MQVKIIGLVSDVSILLSRGYSGNFFLNGSRKQNMQLLLNTVNFKY